MATLPSGTSKTHKKTVMSVAVLKNSHSGHQRVGTALVGQKTFRQGKHTLIRQWLSNSQEKKHPLVLKNEVFDNEKRIFQHKVSYATQLQVTNNCILMSMLSEQKGEGGWNKVGRKGGGRRPTR